MKPRSLILAVLTFGVAMPAMAADLLQSGSFKIHSAFKASDQLVQLTGNADDCCPVWSPDGRWIAFSRTANNEIGIYVVPALRGQEHAAEANGQNLTAIPGGTERKLDTSGVNPKRGELAWSPDGQDFDDLLREAA